MANNFDEDALMQQYEEYMRTRNEVEAHPVQNILSKRFFISHLYLTDS